jgi:hypothetical protein
LVAENLLILERKSSARAAMDVADDVH